MSTVNIDLGCLSSYLSLPFNNVIKNPLKKKRVKKHTVSTLREAIREVHGDRYELLDTILNNTKNEHWKVNVKCNKCDYIWYVEPSGLIHNRTSCPSCSGNIPWTLERFLLRGKEIHGNRYDYSNIREEHIKNGSSKVPIKCLLCGYEWNCLIQSHINSKRNCPQCSGHVAWTYERFMKISKNIYGDKFDYSLITYSDNFYSEMRINLICTTCKYIWNTCIHDHISKRSSCPSCMGCARWTPERFFIESREVHGDKYDYLNINEIKLVNSRINITCKKCEHKWNTSVHSHINKKAGCKRCSSNMWTLDKFLISAKNIHGDIYDYSKIKETDVISRESRVQIICKKCLNMWATMAANHGYNGRGCPVCKSSRLEKSTRLILEKYENINIISQYSFPEDNRKYDLCIQYPHIDKLILIELDGKQHFEYIEFFCGTLEFFEHRKYVDLYKTYLAYKNQCYIIRLDYTLENNKELIAAHINTAFELFKSDVNFENKWIYFSDIKMYDWITSAFEKGTYPTENPKQNRYV